MFGLEVAAYAVHDNLSNCLADTLKSLHIFGLDFAARAVHCDLSDCLTDTTEKSSHVWASVGSLCSHGPLGAKCTYRSISSVGNAMFFL